MKFVCRICGYDEQERREQGCAAGQCPISREVGKPQIWCLMNAQPVALDVQEG